MEGGTISKYILTGHWGLGNSDDTVDLPHSIEEILGNIYEIESNPEIFDKPLRYTIEHVGE
jgi:hypothetical protein